MCGKSEAEACLTSAKCVIAKTKDTQKIHTLKKTHTCHDRTTENNQKEKKKSFLRDRGFMSQRQLSTSVSLCVHRPWKIKAVLILISVTHATQFITLIQQGDKVPTINDVPSVTMPSSPLRFLYLIKNKHHLPHQLAHM